MGEMGRSDREIVLAEYTSLRQEIDARAGRQHNILTTQLFVAGAIFSYVLSNDDRAAVLLILPVTSYLLLGRFADQQHAMTRISTYIRDDLSRRAGGELRWDRWLQDHPREHIVSSWMVPMLLVFPGTALLALAGSTVHILTSPIGPSRWVYGAAWAVELLITATSVLIILRIIRLSRGRWWPRSGTRGSGSQVT